MIGSNPLSPSARINPDSIPPKYVSGLSCGHPRCWCAVAEIQAGPCAIRPGIRLPLLVSFPTDLRQRLCRSPVSSTDNSSAKHLETQIFHRPQRTLPEIHSHTSTELAGSWRSCQCFGIYLPDCRGTGVDEAQLDN